MTQTQALTQASGPSVTAEATSPRETLRCANTADFLAALPLLTGFTDQNSLFIVLFQGRTGGSVLRMELPETQSRHHTRRLLDAVATLLEESGAGPEGPAMVITTSQRFDESVGPPWGRLAHQLKRLMHRRGWRLRELAIVGADGWSGLLSGAPVAARPLSEITDSEFARSLHDRGSQPRPLTSIGELPPQDPDRAADIAELLSEIRQRDESPLAGSSRGAVAQPGEQSIHSIRRTAALAARCFRTTAASADEHDRAELPKNLPAPRVARLIAAAQSHSSWLVLALTALTRAEFVVDVALETGVERLTDIRIADNPDAKPGTREAWSIQHLLHSLSHELPEQQKLRTVVRVVEDAVAHAPRELRPALLGLLAWAWWMLGLQSVAARVLAQSHEIQADHELTLMMQSLIERPPAAHLHRLRNEFGVPCAAE